METRYDAHIAALRAAALPGRQAPPELENYLQKVRRQRELFAAFTSSLNQCPF